MRRLITTAITIAIATLITPTQQATIAGAQPVCTDDYTILVGGTGDPTSAHVPFQPVGHVIRIQYPASIFPAGPVPADVSVREGVAAVRGAVAGVRVVCRGAVIRVAGYSLGAWVAGNYCDTDPLVRCVLIADPRNVGGVNAYLPDFPGITFQGAREPRSNTVQICGQYDVICDADASDPVDVIASTLGYLAGFVGLPSTHGYVRVVEPLVDVVVGQVAPLLLAELTGPLPFEVPSPREVVELVTPERSMVEGGPYIPRPVEVFLPPVVNAVLPEVARAVVPPPVFPPLPKIPGLT